MFANLFRSKSRSQPRLKPGVSAKNSRSRLTRFEPLEERRLLSAGGLDPSFGTDGIVKTDYFGGVKPDDAQAYSMALQTDGKIVVAGAHSLDAPDDVALARYNSDGSLDDSFGNDGRVITSIGTVSDGAYSVAMQSDGKVVIAGYSNNEIAGVANKDFLVARYDSDGSLDTSFDTDGIATTPIGSGDEVARSVTVQADGKIVVAGSSKDGSNDDFALVRYNADGSLDTSFGVGGIVTTPISGNNDSAYSVALQTDGKIIAGGYNYNGSGNDFVLVRYNDDGSLDGSFGAAGTVATAIGGGFGGVNSIALQADGKIVAAGSAYNDNYYDFSLARYNTDGSLDTSFDTDGIVTTSLGSRNDMVNSVALQSDGKIVAAGHSYGSNIDFGLARYNTDGSLDTSFDADGMVTTPIGSGTDVAHGVAVQDDGNIVVAGFIDNGSDYDVTLARYLGSDGPATHYVDASAAGGNGSSWASAYSDSQLALDVATEGDHIWVAEGTYTPTAWSDANDDGTIDDADGARSATFSLIGGVDIYGGFAGDETVLADRRGGATILSGDLQGDDAPGIAVDDLRTAESRLDNAYSVVTAIDLTTEVTLDGLTISGGNVNSSGTLRTPSQCGAGIYSSSSTLKLGNVTIAANSAYNEGAGIFSYGDKLTISNSTIAGNSASSYGGGIYSTNGTVTLTDSTISGNSASSTGGGIYCYRANLRLTNSTISGNSASSHGGGIWSGVSSVTLANSAIEGNATDKHGGGIHSFLTTLTLDDSTIEGNAAGYSGGGVYCNRGTETLTNSTISGNSASAFAGGIYSYLANLMLTNSTISGNSGVVAGGIYGRSGTAKLANSMIAGNSAEAVYPDVHHTGLTTGSNNLIGDGTGQTWLTDGVDGNQVGTATSPIDPMFVDPAGGDYRLLSGSPAIDMGSALYLDEMDSDGDGPDVEIDLNGSGTIGDYTIANDLDGNARVFGVAVDMGALEYSNTAPAAAPAGPIRRRRRYRHIARRQPQHRSRRR